MSLNLRNYFQDVYSELHCQGHRMTKYGGWSNVENRLMQEV